MNKLGKKNESFSQTIECYCSCTSCSCLYIPCSCPASALGLDLSSKEYTKNAYNSATISQNHSDIMK